MAQNPFDQLPVDPVSPDATLPPAPAIVPPNVTQDPRQKLLQLLSLGMALGSGPRSGIGVGGIHGLLSGEGQLQQALNQRAQLQQAVVDKQRAELVRMQQQAQTDERIRQKELLDKLQVIRTRVDAIPTKAQYDTEIGGYAGMLRSLGYRGIDEQWLRSAVPYTAPSAESRAQKILGEFIKNPANKTLLEQDPQQLMKATIAFDIDGDGVPEQVPIARVAQLTGQFAMGPDGQLALAKKGTTIDAHANADGIYQDLLKQAQLEGKDINSPRVTAPLRAEALRQAHEATREPAPPDEAVPLTPAGLDAAALQYAKTGTLPPMGMSKQGAGTRAKIINRAAELYPGLDTAGNKAGFAADQASLKKLQELRDSVGAFEKTAGANLDRFVAQARKVADTGSPLLNQPLRSVKRKLLGDADMAAFEAARLTAQNEIARVLNTANLNGQLTDNARKEMQQALSPDATLPQILSAARILRADMQTRRESYDAQLGEIKTRMKGKPGETPAPATDAHPPLQKYGATYVWDGAKYVKQ